MRSLQRSVISPAFSFFPAKALWCAWLAVMFVAALIVARACGYQSGTVARYAGYLACYVALPGIVTMYLVNRGTLPLAHVIALAVPTGFALEIFTFLGLSAVDARAAYSWAPFAWIALLVALRGWNGEWPVRARISGNHAGLCVALGIVFLATVLMAASQMFAEAPLAEGLPTRTIFHDWVYLVSRAGVIKNTWPLDDPSLSGTPLQYHYFMMVHAAAASSTTGVELTAVMLRLVVVPLGAVLVAQAHVLGRAVSRSPWGGVIAALLTVMADEMSFAESYRQPMFLGLFVRWLFVSPTFFFGLIFCGALLLGVARCARAATCGVRHYVWLLLLAAAGTGAKGTVLPVVICALGLWAAWRTIEERRVPLRPIAFALCLTIGFALVYLPTMSQWGSGTAAFNPFHAFQLTEFWNVNLPPWKQWFAQWLPAAVAGPVASVLCAAVVFAGTCGVRLLAIPYLFWRDSGKRDSLLVGWLGAFFLACAGMGLLMELNSYGELYLILMIRLPLAVLTAAFVVEASRRMCVWWRETRDASAYASAAPFALAANRRALRRALPWLPELTIVAAMVVFVVALGIQTSLFAVRNRIGFGHWLSTSAQLQPEGHMQMLREALLWVRNNTEADAVLVANSFTPENLEKDHWGALDGTLMGVHFYYSALSERRLWLEGPNYILDAAPALIRSSLASNFFYRGQSLEPRIISDGPSYALIDRSLRDGAEAALPDGHRVFSNSRIEVYRISPPGERDANVIVAAMGDRN